MFLISFVGFFWFFNDFRGFFFELCWLEIGKLFGVFDFGRLDIIV